MLDIFTVAATVFMGFFAIMNPIANTAVFVGMAGDMDHASQRATAIKAVLTAFFIVAFFCLLGKAIFNLFGITLPALRLSGGILVFLVGYHMLQGNSSKMHSDKNEQQKDSDDIAISPLAIPILAGPGTIATAMNYSAAGGVSNILVTIGAFGLLCVITLVCFLLGKRLIALIGIAGLGIITRLMGLILTVIGMQMGIQGAHDAYQLFDKW
ncbi:MarC family protein [Parasalinivibrio latis]|uniref:MarC family protein n=1 Tax=Parasalinivibrio latis TaxID=2952610 RepID=UPI0030DDFD6C